MIQQREHVGAQKMLLVLFYGAVPEPFPSKFPFLKSTLLSHMHENSKLSSLHFAVNHLG